MSKRVLVIGCLLAFAFALAGCHTVNGMGKDLSSAGQGLSNMAS